jgi:serine/threonine protein kinase/CRP-like cAMP-binding protein
MTIANVANVFFIESFMPTLGTGGSLNTRKREAINEHVTVGPDFQLKNIPKADLIRELLMGVVKTNVLFQSCTGEEQVAIVDAFEKVECAPDEIVIKQGTKGEDFFVVESGTLEVLVKTPQGGETRVGAPLGPGAFFGELALMYNTVRAASIKTTTDCVIWRIDRSTFRGLVVYYKRLRAKQYLGFLTNVSIMNKRLGDVLSTNDLSKLCMSFEIETFQKGDTIIREGNTGDHFYIIKEGTVSVSQLDPAGVDQKLRTLTTGSYFGERALIKEDVRSASVVADTEVHCLTLGREDFTQMMGTIEELIENPTNVNNAQVDILKDDVKVEVLEGAVDETVKTLSRNPTNTTNSEKRNTGRGSMMPFRRSSVAVKESKPNTPREQVKAAVQMADLRQIKSLGRGAFGRVILCKHPKDNSFYALKCQSKKKIVDSGLKEHILNEMHIMGKIEHPFIARLHAAFQDNRQIYFLLEVLNGGELFTYLRKVHKFPESQSRFYSAIIVYAFCTLHSLRIAYRDLKPENLVLTEKGYVKVVDFGFAKQCLNGKTYTLCGTPDYLAPELIRNEGHDIAVDYWALGILIYEMTAGVVPFYGDDPMQTYQKILAGNPKFPSFFSNNLVDIVTRLLNPHQSKRLGNDRSGIAAVIKHKWFSSFDWASMENGTAAAPYIPVFEDLNSMEMLPEGQDLILNDPKSTGKGSARDEKIEICDWTPDLTI